MSDKLKPGRGIELPFVEGGEGKPWRFKFNPFVTLYAVIAIWCRPPRLFVPPPAARALAAGAAPPAAPLTP